MKKLLTFILALVMLLSVTACGSSGAQAPQSTEAPQQDDAAETKPSDASVTSLTMGSAGTSGAFYIIGAAMANEVNNNSDSLNIVLQSTAGTSENLALTESGEMDMGWSTAGSLFNAYFGTGWVPEDEKVENITGVMSLQFSFGQMLVRKDSGIENYGDLKGKKVCVGTTTAEVYDMSMAIMRAYGIDPEKDIEAFYLSQDEGCQKLQDGDIDATFIMAGIPTAAFTNLATDGNYDLVSADKEILEQLVAEDRSYNEVDVIPAGTYPNIDHDVYSLKAAAEIFCRRDISEDLIYEFCKQVYDHWDTIQASHGALADVSLENLPIMGDVELHPGAVRFYKEVGLL